MAVLLVLYRAGGRVVMAMKYKAVLAVLYVAVAAGVFFQAITSNWNCASFLVGFCLVMIIAGSLYAVRASARS